MPQNAYLHPADLPLDLQLDLLVDGELPDARRRELLERLDGQPGEWRTLALRFLQQQTEKQSIKALMKGGTLVPVEVAPPVLRRPVLGRVGWYRLTGVAAGLFIAAGSSLVTLLLVRPLGGLPAPNMAVAEFKTTLPADMLSAPAAVPVSVPIVPVSDNAMIFPTGVHDPSHGAKTSFIVEPDGNGGYMVIPVSMSKSPVY